MHFNKEPYIFVIGNEKGGAGKTTCSMHLIISLLEMGYKVASIDIDSRQHSLTTYIDNRKIYNSSNPDHQVDMPIHFHLNEVTNNSMKDQNAEEAQEFEKIFALAKHEVDYIVIDTPGSNTHFSRIAHSYANTVITPINDSFLDLDVLAKINSDTLEIEESAIYSQMLLDQRTERTKRDQDSINWVVVCNRLSNLGSHNKLNIAKCLDKLSKILSFRIVPGFSERVIYRELFLQGLTLLDLKKANFIKSFSVSHVAARQELRNFVDALELKHPPTH